MIGRGGFTERVASKRSSCSECQNLIKPGTVEFVALRTDSNGRQRTRKRVCSQDCVDAFDYAFWSSKADERLERERKRA